MISRRNIRIKVMQTLYSLATTEEGAKGNKKIATRILEDKLEQVLDIFTVSVLYTLRVAEYAETDSNIRSAKYLRTEDDNNVNLKILQNEFVKRLQTNQSLAEKYKISKLERFINAEWVKKIYRQLADSLPYKNYISAINYVQTEDKEIIKFIWDKLFVENEEFIKFCIDELPGWEDDQELILMLMQNFFKFDMKANFLKLLSPEKREYAHELLQTVIDKDEVCLEFITPKLTNWDKERVAHIDLILMKMGVCEFLFFPTIPTKVTINEFIDIAKQYSTPQSGQFVNGVLDNILKDLVKENKINKKDRTTK